MTARVDEIAVTGGEALAQANTLSLSLGLDGERRILKGVRVGVLILASCIGALIASPLAARGDEQAAIAREAPCAARASRIGNTTITWHPAPADDREVLDRWCRAVGPPLVVLLPVELGAIQPTLDAVAVLTWNAHLAEGDLSALLQGLRAVGIVLGGDLNTIQGGSEEEAYIRARAWSHSLVEEDARSTHRMGRIDYLFFRLSPGWAATTSRIDEKFGSDHHPVLGRVYPVTRTPAGGE